MSKVLECRKHMECLDRMCLVPCERGGLEGPKCQAKATGCCSIVRILRGEGFVENYLEAVRPNCGRDTVPS